MLLAWDSSVGDLPDHLDKTEYRNFKVAVLSPQIRK